MINNQLLNELHIGKIIKKIAQSKGISSKRIAATLNSYKQNSDQLFCKDDMNIDDLIRISYLLEYNVLYVIVKEYLPHLSFSIQTLWPETYLKKIDIKSNDLLCGKSKDDCDFLCQILIGEEIKKVADINNWNRQEVAEKIRSTSATVLYLYTRKSIKLKKLIQISESFQYDFISYVYLSKICF